METLEEANVRLVREHFAAESRHDYAATLATLADDVEYRVVAHNLVLRGKGEATRFYDAWWRAFPDVTIEITRLAAAGEWVVAECVSTATHLGPFLGVPPTGRTVRSHVCALIRVRDGKMVEETVYFDQLERLRQIGSALSLDDRPLELPSA